MYCFFNKFFFKVEIFGNLPIFCHAHLVAIQDFVDREILFDRCGKCPMLCLFFDFKWTISAVKSTAHVMPCFMRQHSAFLCGGLAFAAINDKEIVKERDCEIVFEFNMVNRSINPVALGIIAAQYFKAVGIYWYDGCAIVHTDTRDAKATWLCDAPRHYPSTTYQKFILPTIRRGCTGDANRAATKMLQRLLGLTPDGIFGEGTENALLKAQEAHGLAVDGICGPASWRAISGANKYL